jgi:hypothetical protein
MNKTKAINLYHLDRNREVIFIETYKELIGWSTSIWKTPYSIVRKAALLRFLIIDGSKFMSIQIL